MMMIFLPPGKQHLSPTNQLYLVAAHVGLPLPPGHKLEPVSATVEVKPEPTKPAVSSLVIGSEARQSAAMNQKNPVKYETSPSLAGKRKKEVSDGSGWALSDSDGDDGDVKSLSNLPKKEPPSPKTKKPKVVNERPPSPHGRFYYIDEPEDFFESSIPCLNDTYRFYLNKVTGLDRKYNSGALHIKGEFEFYSSHDHGTCLWLLISVGIFCTFETSGAQLPSFLIISLLLISLIK